AALPEPTDDEAQVGSRVRSQSRGAVELTHKPGEPAEAEGVGVAHVDSITQRPQGRERLPGGQAGAFGEEDGDGSWPTPGRLRFLVHGFPGKANTAWASPESPAR